MTLPFSEVTCWSQLSARIDSVCPVLANPGKPSLEQRVSVTNMCCITEKHASFSF